MKSNGFISPKISTVKSREFRKRIAFEDRPLWIGQANIHLLSFLIDEIYAQSSVTIEICTWILYSECSISHSENKNVT